MAGNTSGPGPQSVFYGKNTLEMPVKMSEIAISIDNNNFAPSLFRSLCEIICDCFDAMVIFFGNCTPSEKYLA